MTNQLDQAARLVAAATLAPRFRGRAACMRLAHDRGDETALRALELDKPGRERAALRGELSADVVRALKLPAVERAEQLREKRAAARRGDRLAKRKPGNVIERATRIAFAEALAEAGFRKAMHGHSTAVRYSPERGAETADSEVQEASPYQAGLPGAYKYRVAISEHRWTITPALLEVPPDRRAFPGRVYLSPTVRVRQSRGTSLVVERRIEGKWR